MQFRARACVRAPGLQNSFSLECSVCTVISIVLATRSCILQKPLLPIMPYQSHTIPVCNLDNVTIPCMTEKPPLRITTCLLTVSM